jgi:hypothetical protein
MSAIDLNEDGFFSLDLEPREREKWESICHDVDL